MLPREQEKKDFSVAERVRKSTIPGEGKIVGGRLAI